MMDISHKVISAFKAKLIPGNEYTWEEIQRILDGLNMNNHNVTALTYNRWNKGMSDILPLLEYVSRGIYKYLGPDYPFTGGVYHVPQNEKGREYLIGNYEKGKFTFIDPSIRTFTEWKYSEFKGILTAAINGRLTLKNDQGKIFRIYLSKTSDKTIDKGYNPVAIDSKLGQELIGKKSGDIVEVNNNKYIITEIQ